METPELAPISRWKNALSRLKQWIQSDASADVVRVTDEDEQPAQRLDVETPSKRFRQAVQQHRAHPRQAHPAEARTNDPEAPSAPHVSLADREEGFRAAHDSLGSGLAQRMLSSALGADPEERDEEDREVGMHIIDEPDAESEAQDIAIELRQMKGPRPITHH